MRRNASSGAGRRAPLVRVPKSIAFDKMDETEFKDMMRKLSVYISSEYWENCSPEQIEQMAGAMPDET